MHLGKYPIKDKLKFINGYFEIMVSMFKTLLILYIAMQLEKIFPLKINSILKLNLFLTKVMILGYRA